MYQNSKTLKYIAQITFMLLASIKTILTNHVVAGISNDNYVAKIFK
jgi:hypothetical protein